MRGVFDEDEPEPSRGGTDRELTLGSGSLMLLFLGLVILCGGCFGLGYMVGHRGVKSAAVTVPTPPGEQEPLQGSGSVPKPSAVAQVAVAHPAAAAEATPSAPAVAAPAAVAKEAAPPGQQAQVRAALPAGGSAPEPHQTGAQVAPVLAPSATFMVQIAAIANPEDAQVLVNALRKRNYAVTARHEAKDNMIHVRVGPFATRAEAEQWRMRLLDDGYNAIVQP